MYEKKHEQLATRRVFRRRMAGHGAVAAALMVLSLALGMAGYCWLGGLAPVDAFLNAAMLMGGMGPVDALHTDTAKIFAGLYALYCGLVLLVTTGILAAPVVHRMLHRFNVGGDQ
jgi:hypothetical protein